VEEEGVGRRRGGEEKGGRSIKGRIRKERVGGGRRRRRKKKKKCNGRQKVEEKGVGEGRSCGRQKERKRRRSESEGQPVVRSQSVILQDLLCEPLRENVTIAACSKLRVGSRIRHKGP
jgi:hypothetical protein